MELAEALEAAMAAGRAAWPRITHDRGSFSAWTHAVGIDAGGLALRGSELYLASACVAGDVAAIAAFERDYLARLPRTIGRVALSPDLADELRQQLRLTMLTGSRPRIGNYRGQGPLAAWVRVCAARLALKLKESFDQGVGHADDRAIDGLLARDASPELLAAQTQHREAFERALGESFRKLPARHKTLLRMHFLDGMNIDDIGVVFRVHRATVARWLVAIRQAVVDELRASVQLEIRAGSSEFSSLVRLVQDDVQLSLRRLLAEEPPLPA
jgi:RNA polymerase sigma-70 factor (ECF subfamily)